MIMIERVPTAAEQVQRSARRLRAPLTIGLGCLALTVIALWTFGAVGTGQLVWTLGGMAGVFGAVTVAAQAPASGFIRSATVVFNVTATADADVTATIAHGLAVVPDEVAIHPVDPVARISLWVETIASRDATNVVITKATTAGSGGAGVQARVTIRKPHTLDR